MAASLRVVYTAVFFVVIAAEAQDDARDVLARVRRAVLQTVGGLPKYVCTQTIDRTRYEPDLRHVSGSSKLNMHLCDALAVEVKGGGWKRQLSVSDAYALTLP